MQAAAHIELDGSVVFESHYRKLEAMQGWSDSPFQGWEPVKVRHTAAVALMRWKLRRVPGQCVKCRSKRRNRNCAMESCNTCCVALGGCASHKVPAAATGVAGAAAVPKSRNLRRCHACGCHKCPGKSRVVHPQRPSQRGLLRMAMHPHVTCAPRSCAGVCGVV